MLHALTNFTSNAGLMQTLFNDFKVFLSKRKSKKKKRKPLSKEYRKRMMKEVYDHFAKHEFLGRGMLINFKMEKKHDKNR